MLVALLRVKIKCSFFPSLYFKFSLRNFIPGDIFSEKDKVAKNIIQGKAEVTVQPLQLQGLGQGVLYSDGPSTLV